MWGSCGQARTRGRSRSSRGTADKEQARDDLIGGVEISMRQYLFFLKLALNKSIAFISEFWASGR